MRQVFTQLFAHRIGFGLAVAPLHIRQNAFKRVAALHDIATIVQVFKIDDRMAAATQNGILLLFSQAVKGHIQCKTVVFG